MNVTAIIAAMTDRHARFIGPLLESLIAVKQENLILVLSDKVLEGLRNVIRDKLPELSITVTTVNPVNDYDEIQKVELWHRGTKILPTGTSFTCLDVESLVLRPLGDVIEYVRPSLFSLAMPQMVGATGRQTYYSGMLCGVTNPMVDSVLGNMVREAIRIAGRSDREAIINTYGSPIAAAYYLLKGQGDDGGGAILGTIPRNWVLRTLPIAEDTGVFQFDDPEALVKTAKEPDPRFMIWYQHEKDFLKRRQGKS